MEKKTRVLIVDDSATMRGLVRAAIRDDPKIEIVAEAADAIEAREHVKAHRPDVITLDIELPGMNGMEFLKRVMKNRPTPVIMVSSMTHKGSQASLDALELGAFECIDKGSIHSGEKPFSELPGLIIAAGSANISRKSGPKEKIEAVSGFQPNNNIVLIGASTGGVEAIVKIMSRFPENCPPTLITQHMPGGFTKGFAERLNRNCAPTVQEATDGAPLEQGRVYIAPGGVETHLEVSGSHHLRCSLVPGDKVSGHCPSVDRLFMSATKLRNRAVGVILTGMGKDGAAGLLEMRNAGAMTIGQDEATSVVYGMPRMAASLGAVAKKRGLGTIAQEILNHCRSTNGATAQ